MTISNLTINSVLYVSYASVAEADVYLTPTPSFPTWSALTVDQKASRLVVATRTMDTFTFTGVKTNPSQLNQFPRTGPDYSDPLQVPYQIEQATILLAANAEVSLTTPTSEIKKVKAGSAEVEYFSDGSSGLNFTGIAASILDLLKGFRLLSTSSGGFVNVSDCPSQFAERWQGFIRTSEL